MTAIISRIKNPFTKLSIGTYVPRKAGRELPSTMLFLSSSHHDVFIGRNQNCWNACNIVRGDTGGGACYVARGNHLFSLIEVEPNPQHTRYYTILTNPLNNSCLLNSIYLKRSVMRIEWK